MTSIIGNLSLCVAVLAAAGAALACVAGGEARWMVRARAAMALLAAGLTIASAALLVALLNGDMRFAYVASHTERALSPVFRVAAFWSGQEGSLLLWAVMLAWMSVIALFARRSRSGTAEAVTAGTLAGINGFFAALLLFAANPFTLAPGGAPADGYGLNPLLQHWAMVAHPPTLFLGYAAFTIPFAVMLGAMAAGRRDNAWVTEIRRWTIAAWLFLGAGIALGAWWAYVELGWGGYWAWDPVENASLLPWLTGTALIHTIFIHEHRGMLKGWTVSLAALTFGLCIFGTYLTRSGVIESVHAFGESLIGTFFLGFLGAVAAVSVAVILWRLPLLRADHRIESAAGREAMVLAGNVLFLVMTATTLVGTIFPLISGLFLEQPVSVGRGFYDRIVGPMALLMAACMAVGPVLVYGRNAAGSLKRGLLLPGAITGAAVLVALVLGLRNFAALVCLAIAVMAVATMVSAFVLALQSGARNGTGILMAAARLVDGNHRRYGGQLSHLGIVLVILGVAGSSLFGVSETFRMTRGQSAEVGGYTLRFEEIRERRESNYTAVEATVSLSAGTSRLVELTPQRRFYDKGEDPSSEVAIRSGWREDVYVSLVGWEAGGQVVALQVLVNPLTLWIWIGSVIVTVGGAFSVVPRVLPLVRTAQAPRPAHRPVTRGAEAPEALGVSWRRAYR